MDGESFDIYDENESVSQDYSIKSLAYSNLFLFLIVNT